ncbi:MAG: MFS transporter [Actinomycetota bacterium]|jgi:MFS family permease|nr:MFS transporter [Actinomycetota bacterium]
MADDLSEAALGSTGVGTVSKVMSAWPMWVLGLVAMIDSIDQYIVRGSAPQLRSAFHVGNIAIAVLFSAFIFVNGLVTVPAGYMGDRWNRTKAMALTITLWSFISAAGGVVPASAFAALVVVRGMLGFGQAVTDPSGSSLLADYYGIERRGRAFSVQQCLTFVGLGVGLELGALVATHFSKFDPAGWRMAFFISAVPGLVIALLVWRLPEPLRGTADRAHVTHASGVEVEPGSASKEPLFPEGLGTFLRSMLRGLSADVRTILRIPTMRFALVGVSAILFTVTAVASWMPQFYEYQLHLAQTTATAAFGGLVILSGIPGTIVGGRFADRWVNRFFGARVVIPGVCLLISASFFMVSFIPMPFAGVYALQVVGFFAATFSIPALRAGLSDSVPAHLRGTGFAAFNLASVAFGAAAAPLVTSFVASRFDNDFRTAFLIVMPLAFVGSFYLLRARRHIEADTAKIFEAVVTAMAAEEAAPGGGGAVPGG